MNLAPDMSVLFLLISCSIVVAVAFLFGFIWAVKSGQWDDDITPSIRILFDESISTKAEDKKNLTKNKNQPK